MDKQARTGVVCEKGGVMASDVLEMDAFCGWLCQHEDEVVGQVGTWFWCPLACWLLAVFGEVYGIDEGRYGRAHWHSCWWLPLPRWAVLFEAKLAVRYAGAQVTGAEAVEVLAAVERQLSLRRYLPV